MKIQQRCNRKVSSKPDITIEDLMKVMKKELRMQAKAYDYEGTRTMVEVSIDDAITMMIKMIEIIFLEQLQEK